MVACFLEASGIHGRSAHGVLTAGAEPKPRSLFDPVAIPAPPNLKSRVMELQSRYCRVNTDEREENVLFFTNNNSN